MTTHLQTLAVRAAVGGRLGVAQLGGRVDDEARRRLALWRDDGECGAQAAEYAMLGGVSAAACTGLVAILKNRETLRTLVDAVISTLGRVIEGWF